MGNIFLIIQIWIANSIKIQKCSIKCINYNKVFYGCFYVFGIAFKIKLRLPDPMGYALVPPILQAEFGRSSWAGLEPAPTPVWAGKHRQRPGKILGTCTSTRRGDPLVAHTDLQ